MNKTVEETRRELFEAWYKIEFPASELRVQNLIGTYTKYNADLSWQAFNAAMDAVVISLPESREIIDEGGWLSDVVDADEVRTAIESTNLGIKIK